jgi:hypothetical protein
MRGDHRGLRGTVLPGKDHRFPFNQRELCLNVFVEVAACLPLDVIVEVVESKCVEVASYQSSTAITIVVTTTRRALRALRSVFGTNCSAGCSVVTAALLEGRSLGPSAQGVGDEPVQDSLAQTGSWGWSENLSRWLVVLRGLTLGVRRNGRWSVVTRVQRLRIPSLRGLTLGVRRRKGR